MNNNYWPHGTQSELARRIGVSPRMINDILHRRRRVSAKRAKILEAASACVLGRDSVVPAADWVFNLESDHPAFFGKPVA